MRSLNSPEKQHIKCRCCFVFSVALLPAFVFFFFFLINVHSAGERDFHFTERSEEFVRAETTQAAAAGGAQRTGGLHR